jgi:integrase
MPKLPLDRNPKHGRHATGQGIVYLSGEAFYTGVYGTPEAEKKYLELVGRWNAVGRKRLPRSHAGPLLVADLASRYMETISATHVKRGEPTSYAVMVKRVMKKLTELFGSLPAVEFGREEFKTARSYWETTLNKRGRPFHRVSVNEYAETVRRAFYWAAGEGLVARLDWMDRKIVPRLRKGRTKARESIKVKPAPPEAVEAVLGAVSGQVQTMIRLQLLTGARPGEVCSIQKRYIDCSVTPWAYRVPSEINKTEHLEDAAERVVRIGPKARAILGPWFDRTADDSSPIFTTRHRNPWTAKSYGTVIGQVCKKLGVTPWTPNQLRHTRLTEVRRKFGLEASGAVGGHSDLDTTQIYAERDEELSSMVAESTG